MENSENNINNNLSFKEKIVKLWSSFTTYEKIWFFSVVILTIIVSIIWPSTVDNLSINPILIMTLYIADVFSNALCELLISKQSKWNFIVSLFVEVIEIATLIVIAERFASMAVTLFFWIPIDIISFINWNKHKDEKEEEITKVRTLKGWQEILIIFGIIVWTFGVGYILTLIDVEGILDANETIDKIVCYLDAFVSAVGVCNGLFILFRFREQWIAWYIDAILETIINILSGQWVLLVLKAAYFTNTTYGYIKWTKYIKSHPDEIEIEKKSFF